MIRTEDPTTGFSFYTDPASGEKFVSVTQLLSHIVPEQLQAWMKKTSLEECERKRLEATSEGTKLHDQLSRWVKGEGPRTQICNTVEDALDKEGFKILDSEVFVVSRKHGFAGTLDFILYDAEGNRYIGDLKTGRTYSVTTGWQLAAYEIAYRETFGEDIKGLVGVHVPRYKVTNCKVFKYEHIDAVRRAFFACLTTFKALYFGKLDKTAWGARYLRTSEEQNAN